MDLIKENFQKIIQSAKADGVSVEMLTVSGDNLKLGYQQKKLEKFESTQTQMAGFRVIDGASQGYAYTENLSEEALVRTYKEALNNAKTVRSEENFEVPLVKPQAFNEMNNLFNPEQIPMERKMEVAKKLEEQALNSDPRVQSVPYSGFSEATVSYRVLNSEGLDQKFSQKYYSGYSSSLVKDGEFTKMNGEGFFARSFDEINAAKIAERGVEKTIKMLGAKTLKTGKYAVVIDREVFPTVLQMLCGYLSAKEVHEGKSLFSGKINQQIAGQKLQLVDDPFDLNGVGVRPFDSEGAPSQKTVLIENGIFRNYLTNLEYSKKMGLPHTASASRGPSSSMDIGFSNLVVGKGEKTFEQLVSSFDQVVHLTKFTGGLHAGYKESTGDISMPGEGFLYENGKLVGPVDQFVMSGNILTLLKDIIEVGDTYNRPGSSMIAPDVLVKSMSFAGA